MSREPVEIWFPIEKDADGHPNEEWEQIYAWPTEEGFRLDNIPFFARDVAVGDIVAAHRTEGGWYRYDHSVERSGHSTFRIWLPATQAAAAETVMQDVRKLGGQAEVTLDRLVAIDAPPQYEEAIWNYLDAGRARKAWDLQVGSSPDDE